MESQTDIIEYEREKFYCQNCKKLILANFADIDKTCANCGFSWKPQETQQSTQQQQDAEFQAPESLKQISLAIKSFIVLLVSSKVQSTPLIIRKSILIVVLNFLKKLSQENSTLDNFAYKKILDQHLEDNLQALKIKTSLTQFSNKYWKVELQVIIKELSLPSPFVVGRSIHFQNIFGEMSGCENLSQFTSRQNRIFDLFYFPFLRLVLSIIRKASISIINLRILFK